MKREDELRKLIEQESTSRKRGRVIGKGRLRTRLNWGFWLLIGAFVLVMVTQFIIRPMLG